MKEAGEGTLEIGIAGPNGQPIANNVTPLGTGFFLVSYTPTVFGTHKAVITFNDENVKGLLIDFDVKQNEIIDESFCQLLKFTFTKYLLDLLHSYNACLN